MLRLRSLKNQYQKRYVRPLYAQTQATPFAAVLDPALRTADKSGWNFAQTLNTKNFGTVYVEPGKNCWVPGTVMIAGPITAAGAPANDVVVYPSVGGATGNTAFGLLANFVGGQVDDLGDENYVGVWRGPDSVYEILAPGFNATGLQAAWAAAVAGGPVPLNAQTDARLGYASGATPANVCAYVLEYYDPNRLVVDLKV